jgi:hypothetical protein
MKTINNDDVEFIFGTPPKQSGNPSPHDPNLPPKGPIPLPKGDIKPLNLNDPKDLQYFIDLALKQKEYQQNTYNIRKQATDKELRRPSSTNITEQINNIIEKGRDKDTQDRKGTTNKRLNDPNISKNRREYYK